MSSKISLTLVGVGAYSTVRGLAIPAFRILLPLYMLSIGYKVQDLGPMATYSAIAIALSLPLIGHLVDLGKARVIGAASGAMVAASLLIPTLSSNYLALVAAYTFSMLGMMAWQPARSVIVALEVSPQSLGRTFSSLSAAFTIARIASPVLAVWVAGFLGYRYAMAVFACVALAGAVLFLAMTRGFRGVTSTAMRKSENGVSPLKLAFAAYLRVGKLFKEYPALMLFTITDRFAWSLWLPMLNAYLKSVCGLGDDGVGLFNSLFAVAMLVTFYPAGLLTDKIGSVKVLIINELVGAVSAILLGLAGWGTTLLAYVSAIVMGISVELWIAGYNTLTTMLRGPESVGEVRAGVDSARTVFSIPAPALGSTLYVLLGSASPFISSMALMIGAALSLTPMLKGERRR